jgi:hypothetical protein
VGESGGRAANLDNAANRRRVLRVLNHLHARIDTLNGEIVRTIVWAREEGASWNDVAAALEMTRQTAYSRYAGAVAKFSDGESRSRDRAGDESPSP